MSEIKACQLVEIDIYWALDIQIGYPARRFERLSECCYFCRLNQGFIPVTDDLEIIIDW